MHVLYSLHRHTRVQHFHIHEKKPIELRIKPVLAFMGTNSHSNPHLIRFLPAGTRVKCVRCHPYIKVVPYNIESR
jgi:hypothetical protein